MTIAVISMIRDAWGGSEELWYDMAKEALAQGHRVIHLGYETPAKHPKMQELEERGLIRYSRPGWVPPVSEARRLFYLGYNYLRKKVRDPFQKVWSHRPDVVLYNGTCYSIAREKALLAHLRSGTNAAFYIIGHLNHDVLRSLSDTEADAVREGYRLARKVFFVSERNLQTACRHLATDIPNAAVITNPVNLASVDLLPFPDLDGPVQLATVGNLVTAHKGQDLLLQALSQWREKDWVLNLYGNGQDRPYLQQLVRHLQLEAKVVFQGTVADVRQLWARNQVLVLPSHMEGMPLAVVEAMLCGRICIATDVGGNGAWIRHGTNGYLVPAPTVPLLLQTLEEAWRQKAQWPHLAREAHITATKLYDPHAGATLLRRIIAE